MTGRPYDAVLCDIDGVLRHWPAPGPDDLDHVHGLPAGTFAAAAFAPSRLYPAISGEVTDEQGRAAVDTDLAGVYGSMDRARRVVSDWSALMPRVEDPPATGPGPWWGASAVELPGRPPAGVRTAGGPVGLRSGVIRERA
ncbi:hypothetical protein [Streptomyces sp. NPDC060333]|uniref:hypothetical protein n=1 Tax=Streptomyces sp. NPDC060333 TaxID=3347098 RepID=UPI0036494389